MTTPSGDARCAEVYDYALGNLTVRCGMYLGHGGPHVWTGRDLAENEVRLEWTVTSSGDGAA